MFFKEMQIFGITQCLISKENNTNFINNKTLFRNNENEYKIIKRNINYHR